MAGPELHERLQRARKAAGLTQDQLAHRLRISGDERLAATNGTRVGDWERRTPRIPFYVVDAIAHVLGVPLATFSTWSTQSDGGSFPRRAVDPELAARASDLEERAADLADRLRRAEGS
jgi:transcriptional regulator with XRE-family HTH domain